MLGLKPRPQAGRAGPLPLTQTLFEVISAGMKGQRRPGPPGDPITPSSAIPPGEEKRGHEKIRCTPILGPKIPRNIPQVCLPAPMNRYSDAHTCTYACAHMCLAACVCNTQYTEVGSHVCSYAHVCNVYAHTTHVHWRAPALAQPLHTQILVFSWCCAPTSLSPPAGRTGNCTCSSEHPRAAQSQNCG